MRQKNIKKTREMTPHIIRADDLPLSCSGNADLFLEHPKVYLPIEKTGKEVCPYCSACYILEKS